jgi:transcription antitermination factor NusG
MPWYAIASKPQREISGADALSAAGFEAFTPCVDRRPGRKTKANPTRKPESMPMMRGYLFANFNRIPWTVLRSCKDTLRGVLSMNGIPIEIPAQQISAVRSVSGTDQPYSLACDTLRAKLPVVGQTVEIISGPFTGILARVDHVTVGHIVALLDVLGGAPVRVQFEHVRAA